MNQSKIIITLTIIISLLVSCTDENITNTYFDTSSSVIGQVLSIENYHEVSLWQAEEVASTNTDSLGYFEFLNVPVGIYQLKITNSSNSMTMNSIEVKKNETTSLGEIKFNNLHWPFYETIPVNNATAVIISPYQHIFLYTEAGLDLTSLESSVIISPPIPGLWSNNTSNFRYILEPDEHLIPNTNYSITVTPELLLIDTGRWGDSLQIKFKTDKFRIYNKEYTSPLSGVKPVNEYYILRYDYNLTLNESITQSAISIEPLVDLDITIQNTNTGGRIQINNIDTLTPGATYTITIGSDLESESGYQMGTDEVIVFTVQPE